MRSVLAFVCLALACVEAGGADYLVTREARAAKLEAGQKEVSLSNGLLRRTWQIEPDCATTGYENLITGASLIRGVKPEARLTVDGKDIAVGGLLGQPESHLQNSAMQNEQLTWR
ncbi:MAG: hypothetical protein HY821_04845 [Acidobacteria bacterium]|nr:hypothetical protein [Acidobacteriota bacterium]